MGESIDLFKITKDILELPDRDIHSYPPLVLAYIGDAVYELIVRTATVVNTEAAVDKLNKKTTSYVKAQAQAMVVRLLDDELSEDEKSVYRRGRNAKTYSTAKNASKGDYHAATGFEALIGYLYLMGETKRLEELIKEGLRRYNEELQSQ